jgi:hypothetical protein
VDRFEIAFLFQHLIAPGQATELILRRFVRVKGHEAVNK